MKLSRPGRLGGGDVLASGFAVAALALLVGFISLPLLSLVIWTVNEEAWRAMASPVTVDALLLSIRTTAVTMAIILLIGTPAAYVLARADSRASGWWIPWWTSRLSCPLAPLA